MFSSLRQRRSDLSRAFCRRSSAWPWSPVISQATRRRAGEKSRTKSVNDSSPSVDMGPRIVVEHPGGVLCPSSTRTAGSRVASPVSFLDGRVSGGEQGQPSAEAGRPEAVPPDDDGAEPDEHEAPAGPVQAIRAPTPTTTAAATDWLTRWRRRSASANSTRVQATRRVSASTGTGPRFAARRASRLGARSCSADRRGPSRRCSSTPTSRPNGRPGGHPRGGWPRAPAGWREGRPVQQLTRAQDPTPMTSPASSIRVRVLGPRPSR